MGIGFTSKFERAILQELTSCALATTPFARPHVTPARLRPMLPPAAHRQVEPLRVADACAASDRDVIVFWRAMSFLSYRLNSEQARTSTGQPVDLIETVGRDLTR